MPSANSAKQAAPDSARQAIFRATVQQAAKEGGLLLGRLIDAARLTLQTREAASRDLLERDALAQSARELRRLEGPLCKRYPEVLLAAFANPQPSKPQAPKAVSSPHFDELELMDEVEVLTSVALARTQQTAMMVAEVSLQDLNALICTLLGLGTVRADANPLRPEIYIGALQDMLREAEVPNAVQLDWIGAMSGTLGQELRGIYQALCQSLRAQGVASAAYGMAQRYDGPGIGRGVAQQLALDAGDMVPAVAAAPAARGPAQPQAVSRRDQKLLTLDKLRRLLSGELGTPRPVTRLELFEAQFANQFENGPPPPQEPITEFDTTVPAALEALTEMRQVDRMVQTLEQRAAATTAPAEPGSLPGLRQTLRARASDLAQVLSLEVVTLMVANMASDPRLLPAVQELVQSLEPALLQLVLFDLRFFTEREHPARLLLQAITDRSMAYSAQQEAGFSDFVQATRKTLAPLMRQDISSVDPFIDVLAELREGWARAARAREQQRALAVETLQHAEARNLLAEKIAREIAAHPDCASVPAVVTEFLCGPWAQVVAQARIKDGAGSPTSDRYQALISALLWSAHPQLARQNVAKLTRVVPRLISTLREGLESIHFPATRASAFMEALMALHQRAFQGPGAAAAPAPVEASTPAREAPALATEPWIDPAEAQNSNYVEIADAAPALEATPAESAPAVESAPADGELLLGSWVEIMVDDKWVRSQLTWASPHGTLFLFTGSTGSIQSMTRRTRDKLLAAGRFRLLSERTVLDGAFDAVAQAALRNSVDDGAS